MIITLEAKNKIALVKIMLLTKNDNFLEFLEVLYNLDI